VGQETALHFERKDRPAEWTLYFPPLKRELNLIHKHTPLKKIKGT